MVDHRRRNTDSPQPHPLPLAAPVQNKEEPLELNLESTEKVNSTSDGEPKQTKINTTDVLADPHSDALIFCLPIKFLTRCFGNSH